MSVCRYFSTPKGCRNNPCRFIHQNPATGTNGGPSSPTRPTNLSQRPPVQFNAPRGVCRYYFTYGNCKLADCKFRHVEPGTSANGPSGYPSGEGGPVSRPSISTTVSAPDALQHLTNFCAPRVQFTKTFQMNSFANLLANAGSKDSNWDNEDARRFLELVTDLQGVSRIEIILSFPCIVPRVEHRRDAISFASTYITCLSYLVSDFVLDSPLHQRVNLLYGLLHSHYDHFNQVVQECMSDIVSRKSFSNPPHGIASGVGVFDTLITILIEYLTRYKTALREHASLVPLTGNIAQWFNAWKSGDFEDGWVYGTEQARSVTIGRIEAKLRRLSTIVTRESASMSRKTTTKNGIGSSPEALYRRQVALLGPLEIRYEPPGSLREGGPRHDNDFEDIRSISIPPTQNEMLCSVMPFLPANIPGAPHHLDTDSMERLLDIQFRLLREELTAPLRTSLQAIISDLTNMTRSNALYPVLKQRGGRYIAHNGRDDSVMVNLYTSVNPQSIVTDRRGISIAIIMDTPPGAARNPSTTRRMDFWRAVSRKRLMQGGLIGLIWENRGRVELFFGLLSSSADDLQASARQGNDHLRLRLNFFDPAINLRVMEWCQLEERDRTSIRIMMVEAPVMYESIRPFLQSLQREPTSVPFAQYLVHRQGPLPSRDLRIDPPQYTVTRPNFSWNLSCLFDSDHHPVHLNPHNEASVDLVRYQLRTNSRLDVSQADAMVDCLTKEFCLIQGPPGTGKSFTGVEIMRTLLANGIKPILLIAFTNHALDHLLTSILDKGITNKIVRLGSRSSDERISEYSMERLERSDTSTNRFSLNKAYRAIKDCEAELKKVLDQLQGGDVPSSERQEHLMMAYPDHLDELLHPSPWIQAVRENEIGWTTVGGEEINELRPEYDFWISCSDIDWLQAQMDADARENEAVKNQFSVLDVENMGESSSDDSDFEDLGYLDDISDEETEEKKWLRKFLEQAGLSTLPDLPDTNRPLEELRADPMVWQMSKKERDRLALSWNEGTRQEFFDRKRESFEYLKTKFENAREAYDECQAQTRLSMLKQVEVIGCTTTGAAKLTKLLNGIHPSVLLVEEAGQVLEAHILGALVRSIEHVILIGDPQQLRPTINNYPLSMDHPRGKEVFKFDQSTMERLDASGMPMSKLTVQRRMRPQISAIARKTLYPYLEDHEVVSRYPDVRGMGKNMFFFHHTNAEGGADEESMSKYNTFEITMIAEVVRHLLRQGTYTRSGSIAVLCMYLGQLAKLRDVLRTSKVHVILDARDEAELQDREGDAGSNENENIAQVEIAEVKITDQVLLRTVDNFQGEEADIIVLSLVRNPGAEKSGAIGFLKSLNRTNVALTRARHGMYVFGNGDLLSQKSQMWDTVIEEFKEQDCYGSALPIACHRHPHDVQWAENPSRLRQVSPDGGCLRPCEYRLRCGHTCPSKCHADDPDHLFTRCYEPCRRACSKGHPCDRLCWEACGRCNFPIPKLDLDCGHVLHDAPCFIEDDLSSFNCMEMVEKKLPDCEHVAVIPCSEDVNDYRCIIACGEIMPCCQKSCKGRCSDCQKLSSRPGFRDAHTDHACGRILHCQHPCQQPCMEEHHRNCGRDDCNAPCRQSCTHHRCTLGCSTPCTPCAMSCPWVCEHHACSVPCGSPCVRLPCDLRCRRILSCGHSCPSLCGEPCEQQQCHACATPDQQDKVVDLILSLTLGDLDPTSDDLDNITITLSCRHTFTVETLDGICDLKQSYERDDVSGRWVRPILPASSSVKTPCCPTCRTTINANRYGRVTKRSNLDLLERNVATRMARDLGNIHNSLANVNRAQLEASLLEGAKLDPKFSITPQSLSKIEKARNRLLSSTKITSVLSGRFLGAQLAQICGIPKSEGQKWDKITKPLQQIYAMASKLSVARTAHASAYEAAFSMLYEQELSIARQGPRPPRQAEVFALRAAKIKVGMAPPRADTRFQVEAIWTTIDVRFMLASLAEKVYHALSQDSAENLHHIESWERFISFVYASCHRDAALASRIASTTSAHRQKLLSELRTLKTTWRSLQFKVMVAQSQKTGFSLDARKDLTKFVEDQLKVTKREATIKRHECTKHGGLASNIVEEEFDLPLQECFKHWEDLIEALNRPEVFYQSVSDEELRQVVSSFTEYSHRGHWYRCPNGHIFTIADCGGANQVSRCNECGATIGGTNHRTVQGVQQDTNLERIAESQGAQRSPWGWNQNA